MLILAKIWQNLKFDTVLCLYFYVLCCNYLPVGVSPIMERSKASLFAFCSSFHSLYLSFFKKSRKSVNVTSAFLTQFKASPSFSLAASGYLSRLSLSRDASGILNLLQILVTSICIMLTLLVSIFLFSLSTSASLFSAEKGGMISSSGSGFICVVTLWGCLMSDLVQPTLGVKSRFKFLDVFSGSSPPEISVPDNNEITRLTVGRVKPLLDLHRLCARQAIMIPYEAWT